MNLVFVGSFEKRAEDDRVIAAQVSIGERQGIWHVMWSEPDSGTMPGQIVWFEGGGWRDMLHVFRTKLAEKTAEGFLPLIGTSRDA